MSQKQLRMGPRLGSQSNPYARIPPELKKGSDKAAQDRFGAMAIMELDMASESAVTGSMQGNARPIT